MRWLRALQALALEPLATTGAGSWSTDQRRPAHADARRVRSGAIGGHVADFYHTPPKVGLRRSRLTTSAADGRCADRLGAGFQPPSSGPPSLVSSRSAVRRANPQPLRRGACAFEPRARARHDDPSRQIEAFRLDRRSGDPAPRAATLAFRFANRLATGGSWPWPALSPRGRRLTLAGSAGA
jgi:hypothetical protein